MKIMGNIQILIVLSLITLIGRLEAGQRGVYVGCYTRNPSVDSHNVQITAPNPSLCWENCENLYFRYASLYQETCTCENIIKKREEDRELCNVRCSKNKALFCGGTDLESIYETGVQLPGPVINPQLEITSDTVMVMRWEKPVAGTKVDQYKILAFPTKTYSLTSLQTVTWTAQNDRQRFEMLNLHPATIYNVTITSLSASREEGGSVSVIGQTEVGYPDRPESPKILEESGKTMKVELNPVLNNNGPISSYRVIVHFVENELIQELDDKRLKGFQAAMEEGLLYYIAAEIDDIKNHSRIFILGDDRNYGRYQNVPLITNRHVHVILGVVSRLNNVEKVSYSEFAHNHVHDLEHHHNHNHANHDEESNTLIIVLTVLCIVAGLLLIGSIIVYGYIRIKMGKRTNRMERHEMSMQGPILEVDNNGYISDSHAGGINFKEQLQQILYNLDDDQKISRRNLSLDIDSIIGIGFYGDVIEGKYNCDNENVSCQIHVISDDMEKPSQVKFLRELNHLLQFGFHKHMMNFLGVCQTNDWMYVIFEDVPMTMKQFMLRSRAEVTSRHSRLSTLAEDFILRTLFDLAEVMEYLTFNKIVHKNLNSYNVRITRQSTIKLSVFGPTLYCNVDEDNLNKQVEDERWYAPEALKFQNFSFKGDVWSWGLVAWEICCLGATPYGSVPTSDLLSRIKKGLRPEQTPFIFDDLYQLFLNCWEADLNDRPTFSEILMTIKQLQTSPNYALNYNNENYDVKLPFYMPLLELKN